MLSVRKIVSAMLVSFLLLLPNARGQSAAATQEADAKLTAEILTQLKDYDPRSAAEANYAPRRAAATDEPKPPSAAQLRDALRKIPDAQLDALLDQLPDTHWDN